MGAPAPHPSPAALPPASRPAPLYRLLHGADGMWGGLQYDCLRAWTRPRGDCSKWCSRRRQFAAWVSPQRSLAFASSCGRSTDSTPCPWPRRWLPAGAGTKHNIGPSAHPLPRNGSDPTADPNYCGSCYGAQSREGQCCNTCAQVGPDGWDLPRAGNTMPHQANPGSDGRRQPWSRPHQFRAYAVVLEPALGLPSPSWFPGVACPCCLQVREAYRTKGWALLDTDKVEQCHHEG